jgi:hypothetical protein
LRRLTNEGDFPVPSQPWIVANGIKVPRWGCKDSHQLTQKGRPMAIVCVGIDLAKNVFAAAWVDESGRPALVRPTVPRAKFMEVIAALPSCLIVMCHRPP